MPTAQKEVAQKEVALTFNAAWDEEGLDTVLTVLRQQKAPATFFVTGHFAERHPDAVRAIAAAGHGIGNHSHSHPPFGELTAAERAQEVTLADRAIRQAAGRRRCRSSASRTATPRPGRSPRSTRSASRTSSGPPTPTATAARRAA